MIKVDKGFILQNYREVGSDGEQLQRFLNKFPTSEILKSISRNAFLSVSVNSTIFCSAAQRDRESDLYVRTALKRAFFSTADRTDVLVQSFEGVREVGIARSHATFPIWKTRETVGVTFAL